MGYSRSSIDLIRDFVAGLQFPVVIDTVVDQGGGVYLLTCDNLYHAQATFKITIGGKVYTIVSVEDEFTMTVKGATAPAAGATFNMYPPFFFHGTPLAVGEAISQEARERNNTPMIWMLQNYTEHEFKDPQSAIEKEITCRLYFLTQGGDGQYGSPRSHDECVKPMLRLKDYFIAVAQQTAGLFQMVDFENDVETFNKFGVYIADRGMDKNWFSKNLSGVLLEATWKLFRNGNCQVIGKPVSEPCDPVRVMNSNNTFDETYPAGSLVTLDDVEHIDSDGTPESKPAMTPMVCTPCPVITIYLDPNVDTFLANSLITDLQIQSALNSLITAAKACKAYDKLLWYYPEVGGNAFAHSFNFVDPLQKQLTFKGGWTHNALGVTGDGVTSYADTGINLAVDLTGEEDYFAIGSYATLANTAYDMGAKDASANNFVGLLRKAGGFAMTGRIASSALALSVPGTAGLARVERDTTTDNYLRYIQNDVIAQTGSTPANFTVGAFPSRNIYLGTFNNNGTPSTKSTARFSGHWFARPFTADESYGWNVALQFFQQSLGRAL